MKKLIIISFLFISYSLFAFYQDIPVTRDLDPNAKYDTFAEWQATHPQQISSSVEVNRNYSENRDEGFLIIVNDLLYEGIETALQTYQTDLANEGFNSYVLEYDGTSIEDLKIEIMIYYTIEDIVNTVLIGDLPIPWFELFEDWNNNGIQDENESWVEFPCDLYFSDIDGNWEDNDSNGVFDYHEGNKHPEIGIGRIVASNMNMTGLGEIELINNYFERNHFFRTGVIYSHETSLAYIDDDWSYWGDEYLTSMQLAYPSVELVNDDEETIAVDYRDNRLIADYEFIQVHVHSGPDAHYFYYNNGTNSDLVHNYDIPLVNPTAHFYNLFACSNSRFTIANNMGGMYIYGSDHCMGTLGSTKTGSMLNFSEFYQPFSDNTIGEALRLWWAETVDVGDDWCWQRAWFYGMIIQGDPSLKREYPQGDVIFVPYQFPTIQQAIDAAQDGFVIFVDEGTYNENILIDGKDITLKALADAEVCIIDGNNNDSVIRLQNTDDSIIDGFTIQNGLAASFGGGIDITGSPTIKNCVIQNNYATHGGGIHVSGSPVIISNIIQNNSVTIAGGGIRSGSGAMVVQNNIIKQNNSDVYGGGIHVATSNIVEVSKNVIKENTAQRGAAICFHNENAGGKILNNLVINNVAQYFHSDFGYLSGNHELINNTFAYNIVDSLGIGFGNSCNAIVINNILWENADEEIKVYPESELEVRYCDVQGGWAGEGNIGGDPQFINPANNNFTLSMWSPCIGAGIDEIEVNGNYYYAPDTDIEGNSRPNPVGSVPDIGAIESILGEPQVSVENYELPNTNYELRNYPNPFNPSTTISFSLTTEITENTELVIYNLKGQKVKDLSPSLCHTEPVEVRGKTKYSIIWDGCDDNGKSVSSGIYFYKLKHGNNQISRKMLLLK